MPGGPGLTLNRAVSGVGTVRQGASSDGQTTLRRAEEKGWLVPEGRSWGDREPMRVYRREDLPKLRVKMVEAGFRFRDDGDSMTTRQVAEVIGVAENTLRRMERKEFIPAPERDTANRRKWRRSDLPKLKRALVKYRDRTRTCSASGIGPCSGSSRRGC